MHRTQALLSALRGVARKSASDRTLIIRHAEGADGVTGLLRGVKVDELLL